MTIADELDRIRRQEATAEADVRAGTMAALERYGYSSLDELPQDLRSSVLESEAMMLTAHRSELEASRLALERWLRVVPPAD